MVIVSLVIVSLLLTACGTFQAKPKTYTIGLASGDFHAACLEGFKDGMAALGYVEGEKVTYISSSTTESDADKIKNLLAQKVDMLFVGGNELAKAAKEAVAAMNTPVIFCAVSNPVGEGFVESVSHPGGNLTGVQVGAEIPKALEWLVKIASAHKVYYPYNPDDGVSVMFMGLLSELQSGMGIELVPGEVHSVEEAVTAIENLPEDIDAIFRAPSPTLDPRNNELSQAAIKRGLPMASGHPLDEAMLLTLPTSMLDVGKQAARMADQVFLGTKSSDLPVESGEYSLIINLKTANAIGLHIPDEILQQADTVIR